MFDTFAELPDSWSCSYARAVMTATAHKVVHGISIISRYGKIGELDLMAHAVVALPLDARAIVATMYCDSSRGTSLAVALSRWDHRLARQIGVTLERTALRCGGHDGIVVAADVNDDRQVIVMASRRRSADVIHLRA
jgi:hypothetical protein